MPYVDTDVPELSTFAGPLQLGPRAPASQLAKPTKAERQDIQAVQAAMKFLEAAEMTLPRLEFLQAQPEDPPH